MCDHRHIADLPAHPLPPPTFRPTHPPTCSYNTLIDVYGKMGNWEEAVNVLALMKSEGVEPVLRTFKCVPVCVCMGGRGGQQGGRQAGLTVKQTRGTPPATTAHVHPS